MKKNLNECNDGKVNTDAIVGSLVGTGAFAAAAFASGAISFDDEGEELLAVQNNQMNETTNDAAFANITPLVYTQDMEDEPIVATLNDDVEVVGVIDENGTEMLADDASNLIANDDICPILPADGGEMWYSDVQQIMDLPISEIGGGDEANLISDFLFDDVNC